MKEAFFVVWQVIDVIVFFYFSSVIYVDLFEIKDFSIVNFIVWFLLLLNIIINNLMIHEDDTKKEKVLLTISLIIHPLPYVLLGLFIFFAMLDVFAW